MPKISCVGRIDGVTRDQYKGDERQAQRWAAKETTPAWFYSIIKKGI